MPIPMPIPRPSKKDRIRASVLCIQMSATEKEFIVNLPTVPAAPTPSIDRLVNSDLLQRLAKEGVITDVSGAPALTSFGEWVRFLILQEREADKHPEWSEPTGRPD